MTRDFKLPCRYVKSHALIDPVDLPLLSQLALATSDRRLEELWLFRCSYHSAYFPVDEECPGELVPISKDERITVPIFVANVLIKHKAASVISSVESKWIDSPTLGWDDPDYDGVMKETVNKLGLSGDKYIEWLYHLC